ncbi:ribonuclease H-like domain-containing protein, partial [Tanacetum coccineum]
ILPTPTKSLHLNNVLITPHIVKNLIFLRQFVRDNNCTIEFDAFGFSIKDLLTLRVLLRCDSTRDLYPVTSPSPIPHAFLVSQHTWHQRFGHPKGEVLRRLVSSNFIPYNNEKPPVLCHACQLGKHVRLSFVTSSTTDPLPHQQHPTEPATQQSPTATSSTPASPSSAQIHSPAQQPFPMAQHTPVQLQFSHTAVPHQTTTVLDQHAPAIIQNPSVNPNPDSVHPMVTRFRVGTNRPTERLNLHVSSVSPLPKSYRDAFNGPNWQNAMRDEYCALIKNKTWTLVPRPPDTNIVRCMWLFHHKYLADGTLSRCKARLVANGCTQLEGVDVDETFNPGTDNAYLLLYVDDIVLTASSESLLHQIIRSLHQEFVMTDLGPLNYFLGISVTRDSSRLFLSQKKYALEILDRAHMANCNPSRTPIDTEFKLRSDGDPVSDPNLYRSLVEAEYRGVANAVAETCWLCNLLRKLHTPLSSSATLAYCDNVSAVYLSCNPVQHQRTKHIEIDIHFVRDLVAAGQVRVLHLPSHYQFVNILTKGLSSSLFEEFRSSLSVRCPPALIAGEC